MKVKWVDSENVKIIIPVKPIIWNFRVKRLSIRDNKKLIEDLESKLRVDSFMRSHISDDVDTALITQRENIYKITSGKYKYIIDHIEQGRVLAVCKTMKEVKQWFIDFTKEIK